MINCVRIVTNNDGLAQRLAESLGCSDWATIRTDRPVVEPHEAVSGVERDPVRQLSEIYRSADRVHEIVSKLTRSIGLVGSRIGRPGIVVVVDSNATRGGQVTHEDIRGLHSILRGEYFPLFVLISAGDGAADVQAATDAGYRLVLPRSSTSRESCERCFAPAVRALVSADFEFAVVRPRNLICAAALAFIFTLVLDGVSPIILNDMDCDWTASIQRGVEARQNLPYHEYEVRVHNNGWFPISKLELALTPVDWRETSRVPPHNLPALFPSVIPAGESRWIVLRIEKPHGNAYCKLRNLRVRIKDAWWQRWDEELCLPSGWTWPEEPVGSE